MLSGSEGYSILFTWVFAEQAGLPVPATPALLAAGAMASQKHLNIGVVILVSVIASILADYLWYRFGLFESRAASRFLARHPDSRIQRWAERLFQRYDSHSLIIAKFVPGISTAIPPLCGILRMSTSRFLLFDAAGALIWIGVFTGIGFCCGSSYGTGVHAAAAIPGVWAMAV
jgi:membrane protein DedA with SNARE-associated domain